MRRLMLAACALALVLGGCAKTADAHRTPASVPTTICVMVKDGAVVDGPGEVEVDFGQQVVIEVTSDDADEVHVHGFDVLAETQPGTTVRLAFTADVPGLFDVELEGRHLTLLQLRVKS